MEGSTKLSQISEPIKDVCNLSESEYAAVVAIHVEMHKREKMKSISAVQLGSLLRICGIRINNDVLIMINPEIILSLGIVKSIEHCYSIKHNYKLYRPLIGCVRFYDTKGDKHVLFFKKNTISLISHEIDHMNGLLISRGKEVKT